VVVRSTEDVTALLREWRRGDHAAFDRLITLVYDQLHRLAHHYVAREQRGDLLQTTSLVNEAYIRLVEITRLEWQDRAHFLAMAATVMRRILVEMARARAAERRGARLRLVEFDETLHGVQDATNDLVAIDEALGRLAAQDSRAARVVEMRFFGGLTVEEIAEVLSVSPNTVKRDWTAARLWLRRALRTGGGDGC
jgi:RNA polymerase sigma factor (TIGR02999 family)